jgi:hypothetical protein
MYNSGFIIYSADVLGFFIPSRFHPIFNQFVTPLYQNFTGNDAEFTVFAGYTVLILSAIAFLKVRTKDVKFWVLSTAVFFVFCLGPLLHVNGIFTITIESIDFPVLLPYAIITKIPIISIAREPGRWDSIVMLNLSVLSGYGLSYIYKKLENYSFGNRSANLCVTIVFASLILFEFLFIPYPMTKTDIPEFYSSLSSDPEDFAIFEIPDQLVHLTYPEYMYYQTVHGKKLISGYAHQQEICNRFTESTPFINNLYFMSNITGKDIINQDIKYIGPSILEYYNIKYIILHENYMTEEQLNFEKNLLDEVINEKPVYFKNDSMYVYHIKSSSVKPFQLLGDGWGNLEELDNTPTRWITSNASIFIYSKENCSAILGFHAMSNYHPRILKICNENSVISTVRVHSEFNILKVPIRLYPGNNLIEFQVLNESAKPSDIPDLNNNNSRKRSVAMQNITLITYN